MVAFLSASALRLDPAFGGGEVVKLKPLIKPLPGGIRKSSRSNACIQAVTVPTTVQYNVIGDVADPNTNIFFKCFFVPKDPISNPVFILYFHTIYGRIIRT